MSKSAPKDSLLYDLDDLQALPPRDHGLILRYLFGFLFCYLLLYNLPFPLDRLPHQGEGEPLAPLAEGLRLYAQARHDTIVWFGTHALRFDAATLVDSGGSDTRFGYVQAAAFGSAALLVGALFVLLDRRGRTFRFLCAMLRIHVRYVLAATLLGYGFHNLVSQQDPADLVALGGTAASAHPVDFTWMFWDGSPFYTNCTGAVEVLAGLLLLFRRTTALGALITIAVLGNVALLNRGQHLPTRVYSAHFLLMAVLLLAWDARRILAVLLTNRPTAAAVLCRPLSLWLLAPIQILKFALAGWLIWTAALPSYQAWRERGAAPVPFAGTWQATEFALTTPDGKVPPSIEKWHHLYVHQNTTNRSLYAIVDMVDYTERTFTMTIDTERHTMKLAPVVAGAASLDLTYAERTTPASESVPAQRELELSGTVDGSTLHVILQARAAGTFPGQR